MPKIKRIHHVALLVEDLEGSLNFWREALGMELSHTWDVAAERARVAFLPVGESEIELVRPMEGDSGLRRFMDKRGPGMHHVCLEVDDLEGMLARLVEKGVQLIDEKPRQGSDGKRYAFIHPKSAHGVLVELYELPT